MPRKEFEYSLSAGVVQDSSLSRFGKGEINYGVNAVLTFGAGAEYLSSIINTSVIPYVKATLQPLHKLTFYTEYVYKVRTRVLLDYYFLKDALLEIDYTMYREGQLVTYGNFLKEMKLKLSFPFRLQNISGYGITEFKQYVYKSITYNQGNFMLSASYRQFSTNLSAQFNWINDNTRYISGNLSLSYRSRKGLSLIPSVQYTVIAEKKLAYKVTVEKRIPMGLISVLYENSVQYNENLIGISFKYDLPFAKTNISSSFFNRNISVSENAQGSLSFKEGGKGIILSSISSVGKGGIALYPFLDLNGNGTFDEDEHIVMINSVKIAGSNPIFSKNDSIVRIPNLMAFISYRLEFSDKDLENIAWRFMNKEYEVLIDPNQYKRIDIPVVSVGEVNGVIYFNQENSLKGTGRILVKIYKKNSEKVIAETLSESDGYISYIGLKPGDYFATIDSTQLSNLNFIATPIIKEFSIKVVEEGDVVEDLDFVLENKNDSLKLKVTEK